MKNRASGSNSFGIFPATAESKIQQTKQLEFQVFGRCLALKSVPAGTLALRLRVSKTSSLPGLPPWGKDSHAENQEDRNHESEKPIRRDEVRGVG